MSWSVLDSKLIASSIWNQDDHTRILWITMLALADHNDQVRGSIDGLAHLARLPLESCMKALNILASPDPTSSCRDFEGRRIKVIEGGWFLLNRWKFRDEIKRENRKKYHRDYYHDKRKNNGQDNSDSP